MAAPSVRSGDGTQAVERAALLLRIVGQARSAGSPLSEVVRTSRLNKPTVRRLLVGMMRHGLIEQDARSRRYYLGSETFVLGSIAGLRFNVGRVALAHVQRLADVSGDVAFLSVPRGTYAACVHREEGSFPIRTHALNVGDRHPLGIGAGSLAMLAALDDAALERTLADNADAVASAYSAAFAPDALRAHVARTRADGYARNEGLLVAGSWGIGVAIRTHDGDVVGALSIAAIDARMHEARQRELAVHLAREAREIATELSTLRGDGSPKRDIS